MGHNSVVSGHSKSTAILRVDELSMGPPDLGCHNRFEAHKIQVKAAWFSLVNGQLYKRYLSGLYQGRWLRI